MVDLNNLSFDLAKKLPKTDCWFRTDLRAYEYGDIDLSLSEKKRLETNQWNREKERKKKEYLPLWFDFQMEKGKVKTCNFNRKYFECKDGQWP